MRACFAALCAILVAGCQEADVKACEGFIKDGLASPTSYDRVQVTRWVEPISASEIDKLRQPLGIERGKPSLSMVGIQYDAENVFGTKIRQGEICAFELRDGKPDDETIVASRARMSASKVGLRRIIDSGALDGTRPGAMGKPNKYECCL